MEEMSFNHLNQMPTVYCCQASRARPC